MADEKKKSTKRPTALKRKIQSDKRALINKSFKSKVKTSLKSLSTHAAEKEKEKAASSLNTLNSLLDKGVKKGIYKQNKADRMKSKATKLAQI